MAPSSHSRLGGVANFLLLALVTVLLAGAVLVRLMDLDASQLNGDEGPAAATAVSGSVIDAANDKRVSDSSTEMPQPGFAAPDFALLDLDGQPVSLSDWRDQPVLINFWATWCGPCEVEMPTIQGAYEAHQEDGLVVLAIAVDDNVKNVRRFFDEHGLTFQPLIDDGNVSRTYQVFGLPSSVFVDPDGVIAATHTGLLTEGKINEYLSTLDPD